MGTYKKPNSYKALPLGFCGIVTEIGLGGVFEIKLWVFRSSLIVFEIIDLFNYICSIKSMLQLMVLFFQILLRILLGGLFIFSAYTKLFPVEYFEYFLYKHGFSFFWVQWFARIIIWLEFFLGFGFIFISNIKKIIIPIAFILLSLFCIQLIYTLIFVGNTDDCGCFGSYMQFTPLQALIKNIISLVAILYLFVYKNIEYKYYNITKSFNNILHLYLKKNTQILIYILIIITPISYILYISPPVAFFIFDKKEYELEDKNLKVSLLYESEKFEKPKIDFSKGKYVIAFLSLTCPHCKIAALKLHALKFKNPTFPVYMILNGETQDLKPFLDESKSTNVPFTRLNEPGFIEITQYVVPTILLINDGKIEKKLSYKYLDDVLISEWLLKN